MMVMNEELIKVFLDKRNVFAVVGASRDPQNMVIKCIKILKVLVTKYTL